MKYKDPGVDWFLAAGGLTGVSDCQWEGVSEQEMSAFKQFWFKSEPGDLFVKYG